MNVLLIIVLAILFIAFIVGIVRGFVKMIFTTAALIVTILLSVVATTPVTNFLKENTKAYDKIYAKILDYTEEKIEDRFNEVPAEYEKKAQEGVIDRLPIPSLLKDNLIGNNTPEKYKELGVVSFSDYVAAYLANIVLKALVFVVLFIAIAIGLRIICALLDLLAKLPVIHQANKILGALFGIFQGLIIVWIIFVVITLISTTAVGQAAFEMINDSPFLDLLYNNNYLLKFITSIFSMIAG